MKALQRQGQQKRQAIIGRGGEEEKKNQEEKKALEAGDSKDELGLKEAPMEKPSVKFERLSEEERLRSLPREAAREDFQWLS